jgi:NADPH:quinone reductase-like Zn-dependent oxidoreductase
MKAVIHRKYGPAREVLELGELPVPEPKSDEVLVKVRAASMHADIWHVVHGRPYFLRLMGAGFGSPGGKVPGTDLAGVVEKVGAGVTRFRVGDAVYGECIRSHQWSHGGSLADFVVAPEGKLAHKPEGLSFQEAAALPTSGFIACQAVFDEGKLKAGERVLVNGAAGGVGFLALQIARAFGGRVTGVDAGEKLELLRQAGAEQVIDYRAEDYTRSGERYDVIIDIPGNRPIRDCLAALAPGGRYVYIGHDNYGAGAGPWVGAMGRFFRLWLTLALKGKPPAFPDMPPATERLEILGRLVREGKLRVRIGRAYPLRQAAEALECLAKGEVQGKVVIDMAL